MRYREPSLLANKRKSSEAKNSGFTLLETLVALGIASILLATLIPISRNTLFRIVTLDDQARALGVLENTILDTRDAVRPNERADVNITIRTSKRALAPFTYGKDDKDRWQPVLVTIETRSAFGAISRTELIRLERDAP
jgi:prepilin-type N-terminal cleavage/methylation domain-containing protein